MNIKLLINYKYLKKSKMKILITKNAFVELLKDKYPVGNVIESYEALPETIIADGIKYEINNVVDDTDNIVSLELNYYSKDGYKFLFPYRVESNMLAAVSNLVQAYKNFKAI